MENFKERPSSGQAGRTNTSCPDYINSLDIINGYHNEMARAGIICNEPIITDGEIHRFANGGKGEKHGWYIFFEYGGAAGVWGKTDKITLSSAGSKELSYTERRLINDKIAHAKAARNKDIKEKQEKAALQAQAEWKTFSATGDSKYIRKKQAGIFGVLFGTGFIAIPIRDVEGKLWSLQKIFDEANKPVYLGKRNKDFITGGRKKGCFHTIGDLSNRTAIYVCEGYATGASIYEATGITTVIAFDAGNLAPVIASIKSKYPDVVITIAGDDDKWPNKDGIVINTGKIKAEEAAAKHNCSVIFPAFSETIKKGNNKGFSDSISKEFFAPIKKGGSDVRN